jgi:hypothetical protein
VPSGCLHSSSSIRYQRPHHLCPTPSRCASPFYSSERYVDPSDLSLSSTGSILFEFDEEKNTPLHLACKQNHPDCVTVLLQYLSGQSSACSEYLHYFNKVRHSSSLCCYGLNCLQEGHTCLHLAAAYHSHRVIQLLLTEYKHWVSVEVLDKVFFPPVPPLPALPLPPSTPVRMATPLSMLQSSTAIWTLLSSSLSPLMPTSSL